MKKLFTFLFLLLGSHAAWSAPLCNVTIGGTYFYNSQYPTRTTQGDTWFSLWGSSGARVSCNDCNGPNNAYGDANLAFMSISNDALNIQPINGFASYKSNSTGWPAGSNWKSDGMVAYNNQYIWEVTQQNETSFYQSSGSIISSTDDGASWCRPEDNTCTTTPPSNGSYMWGDTVMSRMYFIQYTQNNVPVPGGVNPDNSDTQINFLTRDEKTSSLHAGYILKSSLANGWNGATNYMMWQGGSNYSAFYSSAAAIQCTYGNVTSNCFTNLIGITYIPQRNIYLMAVGNAGGVGMQLWTASSYLGPYIFTATTHLATNSQVTSGFPDPLSFSVSRVRSNPNIDKVKILWNGDFSLATSTPTTNAYSVFWTDFYLTDYVQKTKTSTVDVHGGLKNRYMYPRNSLLAEWRFVDSPSYISGSTPTAVVPDFSPGGAFPLYFTTTTVFGGGSNYPLISNFGLENGHIAVSAHTFGYSPTPLTNSLSDFTVAFVALNVTSANDFPPIVGGNYATSKGISITRNGSGTTQLSANIPGSSFGVLSATNVYVPGKWMAGVYTRKSGGLALYMADLPTVSSCCYTTASGVTPLGIGTYPNNTGSSTYMYGTYALIYIWNRGMDAVEARSLIQNTIKPDMASYGIFLP